MYRKAHNTTPKKPKCNRRTTSFGSRRRRRATARCTYASHVEPHCALLRDPVSSVSSAL